MRVTNRMIIDRAFQNASSHLEKMAALQAQLGSGRRITKPSDDPSAVNQAMLLRSTLEDQNQYVRNVDHVNNWLETADKTLGQASDVLNRARELAVQGASDTQNATSRASIAKEVRQLKEQLRGITNTQLVGRYIFAGSQTLTEPYPATPPDPTDRRYNDRDALEAEIGPNIRISYNITGVTAFGATDDPENVFQVLEDLAAGLEGDDREATSAQITRLDSRLETLSLARAELGGKRNRTQLLADRYASAEVSLRDLLSKAEEADMPKVMSELSLANTVYQASLAASARIIQPSLMEFLR